MRIILTGKTGTGKSAIAKRLLEYLNSGIAKYNGEIPAGIKYKYIGIDNYRVKYSDGSLEGEMRAYEKFKEDARNTLFSVVECTGFSYHFPYFLQTSIFSSSTYIEIRCNFQYKRLMRIFNRDKVNIPIPYDLSALKGFNSVVDFLRTKVDSCVDFKEAKYDSAVKIVNNEVLTEYETFKECLEIFRSRAIPFYEENKKIVQECKEKEKNTLSCRKKFCQCVFYL